MPVFSIREAKANLSVLIEKASAGEEVLISRGSKPVVRLVPFSEVKRKRRPGALKDKLVVDAEFFEPLPESELFHR